MSSITWLPETNSFAPQSTWIYPIIWAKNNILWFSLGHVRNFTYWLDKTAGSQPAPMNTLTPCPKMASLFVSSKKICKKTGSPHVAGQHLAKNYRPSLQTCLPVIAIFQHPSSLKSWIVGGPESLPRGQARWRIVGVAFLEPLPIPFMEAIDKNVLMPAVMKNRDNFIDWSKAMNGGRKFGKGYVVLKRWEFHVHSYIVVEGNGVEMFKSDVLSDSHGHFVHWWR